MRPAPWWSYRSRSTPPPQPPYFVVSVDCSPQSAAVDFAFEEAALRGAVLRHGGFTGMLLGSVSQGALHHARCPVMTVPHAHDQ